MQRKEVKRLKWQKVSGGNHLHSDGKRYKKGDILLAHPHELSDALKSDYKCLDIDESKGEEIKDHGILLEIHHKGGGWYDVINTITGEPLNDSSMKRDVAKAFIVDFEKGNE